MGMGMGMGMGYGGAMAPGPGGYGAGAGGYPAAGIVASTRRVCPDRLHPASPKHPIKLAPHPFHIPCVIHAPLAFISG